MSGYACDYGVMAIFDGIEERHYTISLRNDTDIRLTIPDGARTVKHPFDVVPRPSTEEERAAAGVTW